MRPARPFLLGAALLSGVGRIAAGQCIAGSSPGFDFLPGPQLLFFTDFTGDKVGDFPSGLEFKTGALEVGVWQGKPALKASSPSAFLIPLAAPLPAQFTVELGVVNRNTKQVGAHTVKLYGGRVPLSDFATGATRVNVGTTFWEVTGGGVNAQAPMPDGTSDNCVGQLMDVRLAVEGQKLKAYADGRRLASLPNAQFFRTNGLMIALEGRDDDQNSVYLTYIRVGGGAGGAPVTTAAQTPASAPPTAATRPPTSGAPTISTPPASTPPASTTAASTTATATTATATTTAAPTTLPTSAKTGIAASAPLAAPTGVSAEYVGAGRFAIAWSPVPGAAEYEVYAKSSVCDCKVSMPPLTDTTDVPQGALDYPGPISIYVRALDGGGGVSPNSAPVTVTTPKHWGAYRVTVNGVRVNRETLDDPAQIDGKRDEIVVTASVQAYDRDGNPVGQAGLAETKVHGDINAAAWSTATSPQVRIKAGSASTLGGLKTGDLIAPTGQPTAISFPLLVWEGILREEGVTVGIVPIVWEVDRPPSWQYKPLGNPGLSLLMSVGQTASKRIRPALTGGAQLTTAALTQLRALSTANLNVASLWAVQAAMTKGFQASIPLISRYNIPSDTLAALAAQRSAAFGSFYQALGMMNLTSPFTGDIANGLTQFYNTWSPTLMLLLNHQDRPIGLSLSNGQARLYPHIVKLDFESVEGLLAAGALNSAGPGIIEVRYQDAIAGGNGDYSIFLKVERLP